MTWLTRLGDAVTRTLASFAILAGAALVTGHAAQQFWETTPFTAWTEAEARTVLSSSPWVQKVLLLVPGSDAAPGGADAAREAPRPGAAASSGSDAPRHQRASLTVTWVAAPIREAHIRLDQLKGHMRDEKYWRPAVRGNPEIIQLTVSGAALPQLLRADDPRLRAGTYLRTRRGKRVPVGDVLFSKDYPRTPEVTFAFPAQIEGVPSITAADEEATVVVPLGGRAVTARFKLRDMTVRGQLLL